MRFLASLALWVALVAALGLAFAAGASWARRGVPSEAVIAAGLARQSLDSDDLLARMNSAVRQVAQAVEPSVVHVAVESGTGIRRVRLGQGSGWVYDQRGHIVTNAHVVGEGTQIKVQSHDGRVFDARVLAADQSTDIAVLRVDEPDGLLPARRATGERVEQGDRVFAFGSPFGFKFSMSEGIVSGLARDPRAVGASDAFTNFIQSDAAVNPGNSGGPLVDIRGRVVGMNWMIATAEDERGGPTRGVLRQSAGVSFAIPLSTIEPVVEQIIAVGSVSKGFLGINMAVEEEANTQAVQGTGYRGRGVAVTGLVIGAPADKAGVAVGEVVTAMDGQPVQNVAELRSGIATKRPGQTARLTLWSGGTLREVTVTLGDLDQTRRELAEAMRALAISGVTGVVASGDQSALITEVTPDSPAARAGLAAGQQVLAVNGRSLRVSNIDSLLLAEGFVAGRTVKLTVIGRDGREKDVNLRARP